MSELGKLLKQARLEKGITLEQLQDSTKIRKRYLEAIEEEDFRVLPGTFYARAFIKSYAEAVGLDSEQLLNQYHHVIPSVQADSRIEPVRRKPKSRALKNTDRIARWASTLLVLFFFSLIIFLIYHYVLSNSGDSEKSVVDDSRLTDQIQTENQDDSDLSPDDESEQDSTEPEPPSAPEPELTFVTKDGSTYIYNVSHADQIKLELDVVGARCWVQVKKGSSGGEEIRQTEYKQGDTDVWELDDSIYIRLGFPPAAKLKVNGLEVDADHLNIENPTNFQFNLVQSETQTIVQ